MYVCVCACTSSVVGNIGNVVAVAVAVAVAVVVVAVVVVVVVVVGSQRSLKP